MEIEERIKIDGMALKDADDKLKSNKNIVLEAVKNESCKYDEGWNWRYALPYTSDRLKDDKAVVIAAIE